MTAVISVIVIVVAYLFDHVPDACLSQLDRAYFASTARKRIPKSNSLILLVSRSTTAIAGFLGLKYLAPSELERIRGRERDRQSKCLESSS